MDRASRVIRFVWSPPVDEPRNASTTVLEALVPMLLWPSVPVVRLVHEDLTVADRFIVEAAMVLAPMRAEDIEELTAIPRDAVVRIAGRLTGLGLLRAEGESYYPIETAARAALERRSVPEHRTVFLTFLYLPATDDMVTFESRPGRTQPPLLQKARTVERAPLPPEIVGLPRSQLLRDRILSGRVAGLPEDIVDAAEGAPEDVVPDSCPAYRCRGHVRSRGNEPTLVLDVLDSDGKRATQCRVTGAVGQVTVWATLAEQAEAAGEAWQDSGGEFTASRDDTGTWVYRLDGTAAEAAFGHGIALSQPTGLQVHDDAHASVVGVNARFIPADHRATLVFARHQALQAVTNQDADGLSPATVTAAVAAATSAYGLPDDALTEAELLAHLWGDRQYRHIYALRSAQDFPYG